MIDDSDLLFFARTCVGVGSIFVVVGMLGAFSPWRGLLAFAAAGLPLVAIAFALGWVVRRHENRTMRPRGNK